MVKQEKESQVSTVSQEEDKLFADCDIAERENLLQKCSARAGFGTVFQTMNYDGRYAGIEKTLKDYCFKGERTPSIMISGSLGVGKTGIMTATFKHYAAQMATLHKVKAAGMPVRIGSSSWFITHEEFNSICRSEIKVDSYIFATVEQITIEPHILILDDLFDVGRSEFLCEKLQQLIDYRWVYRKPTWITSNLSIEDLKQIPGYARIVSRLSDRSWMDYFIIPGKDRRLSERS